MKLKPDDVRNSERNIMTLTTVTVGKSERVKPIIAHSKMGQNDKDSPSSPEESSPLTTTANEERTDRLNCNTLQVSADNVPDGNYSNNLACKDEDDNDSVDSVEALVMGLKECQIIKVDSDTKEISDSMVQLHLEDVDEKKEKKEAGTTRRQEPEEDDESEHLESHGQKEEKESVAAGVQESQGKKPKEEIKMVKLEAPCKEEEGSSETEADALQERGPKGIPVYHNYPRNQPFNFTGQDGTQNELCDQTSSAFLPNSNNCTANYNCQPQQGLQQMPGIMGGKRGINDLDFYEEAPKFFRPQNEPQMSVMNGYNNLDAPGKPNNKLKSFNKVCHRQMSGGTVITNSDASLEVNGSSLSSLTNHPVPPQQQTDRLDPLELQEILSLRNFVSAANDGVFDIEELLDCSNQVQDPQECVPKNDPYIYHPQQQNLHCYHHLQQHQEQTFPQPVDVPVGQNLNMSVQSNLPYQIPQSQMGVGPGNQYMKIPHQQMPAAQAQTQFHLEQERSARLTVQRNLPSPGKVMSHLEDAGYISDMSPSHEAQFPPTPSPQSIMAASPDPSSGSPPQQNWSPPPSNLSMFSQDSGVFSPNADFGEQQDDFGNYTCTFIDDNLPALEDALKVAEEDLRKKINLNDDNTRRMALNIPSTVPQDITTSPSLQQSPESLFRNAPSSAQIGRPVAMAIRKTNPKKPMSKGPVAEVRNISGQVNEASTANKILISQPTSATSPAGTLVISSAAALTPNSPPMMNSQGKVAIPPSRQKPRVVQGTPVLPCVITPNGITPVFVLSQEKPRYAAIAPKTPSKPAEHLQPAGSASVKVASSPAEGQNPTNKTAKRSPTVKDKLNIARRSVAELKTSDLIFRDHEGDTHLHVASVKADECLIESIMERLVREELSHMVNEQNVMGQTPLYLAVCENKPEMVEVLVRFNADVKPLAEVENVIRDDGTREKSAAIHRASSSGEHYLRTLRELLKSPTTELDQMDSEGHTALHCAILSHGKIGADGKVINSIPIIEALIQAGANANLQVQKNGKTGLMFALESRNIDLIESTFKLIDPVKLPTYLKTESFDGITCHRLASSIKSCFSVPNQQRLSKCLKPHATSRLDH